jgi:hypothetical protein
MSVNTIDCVNDAASLISDPGMTSVTIDQWKTIFNRSQRKVSTLVNMLEAEALFDVQAGIDRYSYPDDMIQLVSLRWTNTPDDPNSFIFLREMMRPEFQAATDTRYDTGDPQGYFARKQWFHLYPQPDTTFLGGGLINYIYVPADIADITAGIAEWPDFWRDDIIDWMQIEGMKRLKQYEEAKDLEQVFMSRLPELKQRAEDRSADRRPAMRPPRSAGQWNQV